MSAKNVARAGKRGDICVGKNVSLFARAFSWQKGELEFLKRALLGLS